MLQSLLDHIRGVKPVKAYDGWSLVFWDARDAYFAHAFMVSEFDHLPRVGEHVQFERSTKRVIKQVVYDYINRQISFDTAPAMIFAQISCEEVR